MLPTAPSTPSFSCRRHTRPRVRSAAPISAISTSRRRRSGCQTANASISRRRVGCSAVARPSAAGPRIDSRDNGAFMDQSSRLVALALVVTIAFIMAAGVPAAQAPPAAGAATAVHAKQVKRLLIKNAMVIPGTGVPAAGPMDVLLADGLIARLGNSVAGKWPAADMAIDASGKYVMPGIINTHMHWHEERVGPIPIQYERNLYLAAGVTTAREVGGDFEKTRQWRAESAAHRIIAPRIVLYPMLANLLKPGETFNQSPAEYRALVRRAKEGGADGIKLIGPMDRDQVAATLDEAKKLGLPTTVHIAVGEATARDFVDLGVNCIEHFYGVADAALDGI